MEKMLKEFILIFRMDITTKEAQPTPAQMEVYMKQWEEWINDIALQNKLADGGNHLTSEGRVIKPNNVIKEEPYTVSRETIAGYILIKVENLDEALDLAKACPILQGEGTSVEVREVSAM